MATRRAGRSSVTPGEAFETCWGGRQDVSTAYRNKATRALKTHLSGLLARPLGSITRDDLLQALMVMNAAGYFVYVRKVRMWVGQVFERSVEQPYCTINPAALIRPQRAFGHAQVSRTRRCVRLKSGRSCSASRWRGNCSRCRLTACWP